MPVRSNPPTRTTTTVKAVRNGPLQVKGELTLLDPTGQVGPLEGMRVSPHIYTLEEEPGRFVDGLDRIVRASR